MLLFPTSPPAAEMNLRIARRSSRGPGLRSERGRDRADAAAAAGGGGAGDERVSHRRGPAGGPTTTTTTTEAVARVHSEDAHTSSWNNSSFAR